MSDITVKVNVKECVMSYESEHEAFSQILSLMLESLWFSDVSHADGRKAFKWVIKLWRHAALDLYDIQHNSSNNDGLCQPQTRETAPIQTARVQQKPPSVRDGEYCPERALIVLHVQVIW